MRIFLVALGWLFVFTPWYARADTSDAIDYAVHGAAFSATVSYCHAKYGAVSKSSPGGACFIRARDTLAEYDLKGAAMRIKQRCVDSSTLSSCITPELSGMVNSLLQLFDAKKI